MNTYVLQKKKDQKKTKTTKKITITEKTMMKLKFELKLLSEFIWLYKYAVKLWMSHWETIDIVQHLVMHI